MAINLHLITKLIGLNALTFSEGEFKIWNVGMMFFPYKVTAFIQNSFEKKFGKDARDVLYFLGKLQGYNGTMLIMRQFGIKNTSNMYELFSEQAAMVGVGTLKISVDEKNKYTKVETINNPYMEEYIKIYGKNNDFSDDYLRGLVTGATEAALGEELVGIETKCISRGDSHCTFEVKRTNEWNLKDEIVKGQFPGKAVDYKALLKKLQLNTLVKSKINYGDIASNFFKTKKVKFDANGKFYLLDIDGMSMPMDTCVLFIQTFKELFGKDAEKILYKAGELFANEIWTERPNSISQLNSILSNFQSFGFGYLEVIRANDKSGLYQIQFSNHNYAKHFSKLYGMQKNPNDPFIIGFVNKILENFQNIELSTIEKQCIMQGKSQFCYFETRSK